MSIPSEPDPIALRYEHEALSQEAASLANTLVRRRANIALMRAEAATVAVSLESAKEHLDVLLRKESDIRSTAPPSPHISKTHADFFPDKGLVRSLQGQLDVTRQSIKDSMEKRTELRNQLSKMELHSPDDSLPPWRNPSFMSNSSVPQPQLVEGVTQPSSLPITHTNATAESTPPNVMRLDSSDLEKKRSSRGFLERNILGVLTDGLESNSSFRIDHAHIWRDVTMPNLILLPHDPSPSSPENAILGVITERIFEGVTCFVPTANNSSSLNMPSDLRIESYGEVRSPDPQMASIAARHFSILSASSLDGSYDVSILAPKVSLERVQYLIRDTDTDISNRWHPKLPMESEEPNVVDLSISDNNKHPSEDIATSSTVVDKFMHVSNSHEAALKIAPRLSSSSKVLREKQLAKIISEVPTRFQESALDLVYSTDLHGMSLHTLYHKVNKSSPTLIAIRDTKGRVFGCYAAQPWKASATRYYGSGESFVFKTETADSATVYKWSRKNSFFQFTSGTFLAIGGGAGSHFALWIDEDLLMGTTYTCSTFESPPLTSKEGESDMRNTEFKIVSLEVWSFVAHRKH